MNQTRAWQAMTLLVIIVFLYLFKILLYDDIWHLVSSVYSELGGRNKTALTESDFKLSLLKHQHNELMKHNKTMSQVSMISSATELIESLSQIVVDMDLILVSIEPLATKQQGSLIEYSFMLQVVGTYKNTGLFIQSLENTFPLTRFEKVGLKPNATNGVDVALQLVIYSIRL
ncbi:MAG: type 4a pilus biogenesis protein PilO [Candidatus Cloacimonetes bacterium]|jgi:Tfp pilus assembly protein PilO|nr:type 4a pilus biogenesis protein PilO [Candidatus Cloacimonadota bacterium]MCB5260145.1 type 4a pilus biogenesis protein PilO [Candidatus Cloacimonadota bacterium]